MPIRIENPFVDVTARLNPANNPYVAKIIACGLDGSMPVKFGPMLQGLAGNWRQQFTDPVSQLVVEVGCHRGETLAAMAQDFPDTGFVGIDITFKRVMKTAEKAMQGQLKNVQAILANAKTLSQVFAPDEIDGLVIFFPDPWVKKAKQAKKRLINEAFARDTFTCIKPGGFVWIKMDQEVYFLETQTALEAAGFRLTDQKPPLTTRPYSSQFERHFQELGHPTLEGVWVKSPILQSS